MEICDSFFVYQARGSPMSSAMAIVRRSVSQSGLMLPIPSCLLPCVNHSSDYEREAELTVEGT